MGIELRFFRERYDMDPDYYLGSNDVYCRLYFRDLNELKDAWDSLFCIMDRWLEGETYSAWLENGRILCAGAFDPSDIEDIETAYKEV